MKKDIQLKHLQMVSNSIPKFHWISVNRTATSRCLYCGDSQTKLSKTRGYFYTKGDQINFDCKNCGKGTIFDIYLKDHFPLQYKDYKLDLFRDSVSVCTYDQKLSDSVPKINALLLNSKPTKKDISVKISDLDKNHPAVIYLQMRMIPEKWYSYLGYTDKFLDYVTETCGSKEEYKKLPNDSRIIIPMKDAKGGIFAFQGRALNPKAMRYITVKIDEKIPKMFGRDIIRLDHPVIITEGPFDAMFLPNALAICGGDLNSAMEFLNPESTFVVLDNEPRSKDTIKRMNKAIELGFRVCFWNIPSQFKDINDMILKGHYTPVDIIQQIGGNSLTGTKAKLKMTSWKKI